MSRTAGDGPPSPYKITSVLLGYPTQDLLAASAELRAMVSAQPSGRVRTALTPVLRHLVTTPAAELAEVYVATFDHCARTSLYLSYHSHGDTRRRGLHLARLKARYRQAGLTLRADELPDYLPVMLEFAALSPGGRDLLAEHRPALELLGRRLRESGSPYTGVLDAVAVLLPRVTARQRAATARLAATGPPAEQVGLEPFVPPGALRNPGAVP